MTKSRAHQKAEQWAKDFWDDPEVEKTTNELCIACGTSGYLAGMKAMLAEAEKMAFNDVVYLSDLKKIMGQDVL